MPKLPINVLFVSSTNMARSILAESCLNRLGNGRFRAFSCGVPGLTLGPIPDSIFDVLKSAGFATKDLHSKSWNELLRVGARPMNFVISLDKATIDRHPSWPSQPVTALWATPPIFAPNVDVVQLRCVALQALYLLQRRLTLLVALPMNGQDRLALLSDIRDMAYMT